MQKKILNIANEAATGIQENTTSGLRLDAREVVVVADVLQARKKNTSDSRLVARWWWPQTCRNTTSGSRLDAREVVVLADVLQA